MSKGWEKDKQWSDKFILEIKRILGETFFALPSLSDDQMKNTDLICMDMTGKRIGCRVRKKQYLSKYPFQFTIRYSRPMGTKTEYQKILDGWGDYFFYGFSNTLETSFLLWMIGDLKIFRQTIINDNRTGQTKQNTDNSSNFKVFEWQEMPSDFFVKISDPNLLMTDVCPKCLCLKIKYGKYNGGMTCPKCLRLFDYRLVLDRHNRNSPK